MQTKTLRKHWWVPRSTALLQDFAKSCGGTYVPAVFKGWKHAGQHVRIELEQGMGTCRVTLKEADSGSGSKALVVGMNYEYQPKHKLEFELFSAKRPLLLLFQGRYRRATLPYSAMNKRFKAKATHPSLLRSLIKYEGLAEALDSHPKAYIKVRLKEQKAVLTLTESFKKPDAHTLETNLALMKLFIQALHSQGLVRKAL